MAKEAPPAMTAPRPAERYPSIPQQQLERPPMQSYAPAERYSPPAQSDQPVQRYSPPAQSYQPVQRYSPPAQSYQPVQRYSPPAQSYQPVQRYSPPAFRAFGGSAPIQSAPSGSYAAPHSYTAPPATTYHAPKMQAPVMKAAPAPAAKK
jgi:hypothetical protein